MKEDISCAQSKPHKTIGILGGMGAAASADFYQHLVDLAQHHYHAEQDHDFPAMMLYNLPLVGFDETGFVDVAQVKKQLIAGVQKLEHVGCDFIVIPCNTVHYLYDDMQAAVSIPIISLVEVVAKAVKDAGYTKVGLLSSQSTRNYHIYETTLARLGIATIVASDTEQSVLNNAILHVISGSQGLHEVEQLAAIVARYASDGAQGTIVGCTELPLAITQKDTSVSLFNSTVLLAEEALRIAYGG